MTLAILPLLALLMPTVNIDFSKIKTVTNDAFYPLYWDEHDFLVMKGSAGSGKSRFVPQKLTYRMCRESGHRIIITRKVQKTLRQSCWAEVKAVHKAWKMEKLWKYNVSLLTMEFLPNGNEFVFVGLDDPERLKSIHEPTSAWLEEATEFMPADIEEIDRRIRSMKAYKQIILTFNPIRETHWIKNYFFDTDQQGRTLTHESSYKDNRFLTPDYERTLLTLKERNPDDYQVYALNQWGRITAGVIFGYDIKIPLSEYPDFFDWTIYGLDFGFTDPSCLMQVSYKDGKLYLIEKFYQTGLTTGDIAVRMRIEGVNKTNEVYCDSAEPDRIEELNRAGFNVFPADKAQGSVLAGISFMKDQTLVSHPGNLNFNAEWDSWSWKCNKDGVYLDEPEGGGDHAIDPVRYAIWTHIGHPTPRPQIFI